MITAQTVHAELARRWNARDYAGMRELMHPDYAYISADGTVSASQEAGIAVAQTYGDAFPDAVMTVKRKVVDGNLAICEMEVNGTHTAPLRDLPATGKRVRTPICNVLEVRDGLIYREQDYFDLLGMLRQLGVAPAQA